MKFDNLVLSAHQVGFWNGWGRGGKGKIPMSDTVSQLQQCLAESNTQGRLVCCNVILAAGADGAELMGRACFARPVVNCKKDKQSHSQNHITPINSRESKKMLSQYRYLVVWFILLLVANYPSVLSAHVFRGYRENNDGFWYLRNRSTNGGSQCQKRIIVDKLGHGNFRTVQSAIDSVPSNNNQWVCITVNAGVYREKINIPSDKPYIYLKGSGSMKTVVVWGDHSTTVQSSTFNSAANNIKVQSLSFVNSYNYPRNNNPRVPAVAALITGDKTSFYRCRFAGVQDTLWDQSGRHYFKQCVIEGAVDFIFGAGKSLYEGCVIKVLDGGFITAQSRDNPGDDGGFVFRSCSVVGSGSGSTYLGRPWREYSRVLFYKSNFSSVVKPQGWDAWDFVGHENHVTFAEYGNYGPGADTSHRVPWEKKLSYNDLWHLTSLSFVDTENWVARQPFDG